MADEWSSEQESEVASGPLRGPIATQGRSHIGRERLLPWLLPVLIALLWVVASRQHWMSEQILPAPALVWQSALEFGSGELWGHLWISLQRLFWGLAAGIASGLLLGVWLGASRRAQTLVLPTFVALAQIPTLAWIPLFMLFFGIGELLKLVVLVKAVVVPVTLHTLVGVRDAQPKLREAAAALRLPRHLLFLRLLLPAALSAFLTGVRLALATGWTSLLAVELLASSEGIGYLMVWGRQLFMLDLVMLCILVIGLVGAVLERSFQPWKNACCTGRNQPLASSSAGLCPAAGKACCCPWGYWRCGRPVTALAGLTRTSSPRHLRYCARCWSAWPMGRCRRPCC